MICLYEFKKSLNMVTEDEWVAYVKVALRPDHHDYTAVDEAIAKLRVDTSLPVAGSRMGKLRADMHELLDENNVEAAMLEKKQKKLVVGLVNGLGRDGFRQAAALSLAATALRGEPEIVEEDELNQMATSLEVKKHNKEEVVAALRAAPDKALANGMTSHLYDRLRWILERYVDSFRVALDDDPPVKVPPLRVRLKPNTRPVKAKLRRYPPWYEVLLEDHVQQLLETGLVKINPYSRWVVPKKITELRMTVDHRAANALTDPLVWPLPDLESDLSKVEGSEIYFDADVLYCFYQLPLHSMSQDMFTIVTKLGMVTPTRVSMGARDSLDAPEHTTLHGLDIFVQLATVGWTAKPDAAVQHIKQALLDMIPLAHSRLEDDAVLYTDASLDHWGAAVLQLPQGQLDHPLSEQELRPVAFICGSVKGASSRWAIIEKEAFAIVEPCKRLS
ncbi:unnamed protein product [Phytophthora fragariaefolia]|uniref:Unnamed protein product n=1 Tax=Phytophthora fragariaefolia TaxID=1490495 RepID=A0A9W6Y0W6_9STRA|nr:unnamed protein product [Phytophthora fragariaefolia]